MSVTYAGVPLPCPTAELLSRLEYALSPGEVRDFEYKHWPGPNLMGYPFQATRERNTLPVRLNALQWPVGASRWAVGRFLADDARLALIRQTAYGGGSAYQSATLYMDDGRPGHEVAAPMYMLPPRPLYQVEVPYQLWLLTLVDHRFFWWGRTGTVSAPTSWTNLYAQIGTLLGVTIAADTVPAAYLVPPADLAVRYEHLPILLDAVAYSVGHRISRRPDGTVEARGPTTAKATVATNLTARAPVGTVHAGGLFQLQL